MANAEIGKRGITERHGSRRKLVFLKPRNGRKVTELGERISQPGDRWFRQIGPGRNLLIAEKPVIGPKCAQHIETAGKRDDKTAISRDFLALTLHVLPPTSACWWSEFDVRYRRTRESNM